MKTLISSARKEMFTQEELQKLTEIDKHDFGPVMKRLASRGYQSDEEALLALKQSYALTVIEPDKRHALSSRIDDARHTHMMFSADYRQFCRHTFGGILDHEPLDGEDTELVDETSVLYEHTSRVLRKYFNEVNGDIWPEHAIRGILCCCDSLKMAA